MSVDVTNLSVHAGKKTLVRDVSLYVEPGTWCTIIGPNGAGKTSLVSAMAGLRSPTAGRVVISGHDLADLRERERATRVAFVPQRPVTPAGMSVEEYVTLGRCAAHSPYRAPSTKDRQLVGDVLERLALTAIGHRDVGSLSGGERQRVVFARLFAQSTTTVILDEPLAGLDARYQLDMLDLLKKEVDECGLTVVTTLHDLTLASLYADQLVLMHEAELVTSGPAVEVLRSEALATSYGVAFDIIDVDGRSVVLPRRGVTRESLAGHELDVVAN